MKGKFLFAVAVCLGVQTNLIAGDYLMFMPFQNGEEWYCPQGNEGSYSHFGKLRYAYDFNTENSYQAFGRKVYSPVRGEVIEKRDNAPDYMYNDGFYPENNNGWGNTVLLKDYATGKAVRIAHMRKGSIKVSAGEQIEVGQLIGEVGQSGFSTSPHLHIHMQNETTTTSDYQSVQFYFVEGPVVTGTLVKSEMNAMTFVIDDEYDVSLGNYVQWCDNYHSSYWTIYPTSTPNITVGKQRYQVKYKSTYSKAPAYRWNFRLNRSGYYYIWVKFASATNKDPMAEYSLLSDTAPTTVLNINQTKTSSDHWYPFVLTYLKAGEEYMIRLRGVTKNKYLGADAIKFQQMPW